MSMTMNDILLEREEMLRDKEKKKNNILDSEVQDAMSSVKHLCPDGFDSTDYSDKELDDAIDSIPDDEAERNEEIERIAQADKDMTLDDVMGIENDDIEDEESEDL